MKDHDGHIGGQPARHRATHHAADRNIFGGRDQQGDGHVVHLSLPPGHDVLDGRHDHHGRKPVSVPLARHVDRRGRGHAVPLHGVVRAGARGNGQRKPDPLGRPPHGGVPVVQRVGDRHAPGARGHRLLPGGRPMSRDHVLDVIRAQIARVLPHVPPEAVTETVHLKQLGADSIDRTDILTMTMEELIAENRLDGLTPLVAFAAVPNIGALADLLFARCRR
ncbi:hypothetical protein D3867_29960 (plasmid) [Azospirillum argentinense]|uniref:Carrier domain-containing protein n=2 Tax=Azospirillum TaxID=191 RepID=A0A4D8QDC4_AZOBR|nr:hypothetical protein D3867_29960 [Azospirillum argentinense]